MQNQEREVEGEEVGVFGDGLLELRLDVLAPRLQMPVGRDRGFIVQVSGPRAQGSGCRVQGSGFRVKGSGCRVQGSGSRVRSPGPGIRVKGAGCIDVLAPRLEMPVRSRGLRVRTISLPGPWSLLLTVCVIEC